MTQSFRAAAPAPARGRTRTSRFGSSRWRCRWRDGIRLRGPRSPHAQGRPSAHSCRRHVAGRTGGPWRAHAPPADAAHRARRPRPSAVALPPQRLYRELPAHVALADLPPVQKAHLMASFDEWVCDRAVTRAALEAFVADPTQLGARYRESYFVCPTSGTTGTPGLAVHDTDAIAVYQASALRIDRHGLSLRQWGVLIARRFRWAVVVATGAHFAASGWIEHERRRSAWRARSFRTFSVQQPIDVLVDELDAFAPAMLTAYPSALELPADAHAAGRQRARPALVRLSPSRHPCGRAAGRRPPLGRRDRQRDSPGAAAGPRPRHGVDGGCSPRPAGADRCLQRASADGATPRRGLGARLARPDRARPWSLPWPGARPRGDRARGRAARAVGEQREVSAGARGAALTHVVSTAIVAAHAHPWCRWCRSSPCACR